MVNIYHIMLYSAHISVMHAPIFIFVVISVIFVVISVIRHTGITVVFLCVLY